MKKINIISIIGARPQFIKAAMVSHAIANYNILTKSPCISEIIIHTGQHYDENMSEIFFKEMKIPKPDYFLDINRKSHGEMTGLMLEKIEKIIIKELPDCVIVYGDTNSTLAGVLSATKLNIPVAHIEAGLRSFNKNMPEEINRVLTDHASNILFCPTEEAVENLSNEGIKQNIHLVGDVMYDSILHFSTISKEKSIILSKNNLKEKEYSLATIHREDNTNNKENLKSIFYSLENVSKEVLPVVIPLHPRTKKKLGEINFTPKHLRIIEPISYLDMLYLENQSKFILTDSGGIQKEAYWLKVPCITLREETEWTETVEDEWNQLVGSEPEKIINAARTINNGKIQKNHYGDGNASEKIINLLAKYLLGRKK